MSVKIWKHKVLDRLRHIKNLYTNSRVKMNVARFKASSTKKPNSIIKKEMDELQQYWGCIPSQYITHNFYESSCKLSVEKMKNYIPGYYFYYVIYPQYDNVSAVFPIVEDKIRASQLFKSLGYLMTEPLILKGGQGFLAGDSDSLVSTSITDWLSNQKYKKLFIKPISGRGGKGIIVAHNKGDVYRVDNDVIDSCYLESLLGDYVIEPGIIQSSYVADVYPNSVNTLRVVTKRDLETGDVSIVALTLRMGCDGREVDNSAQGGLLVGIDIDTGMPIHGHAVYEYGSECFYEHPDTGYIFSDFYVRDWSAFKLELLSIAERMSILNLAGWDIAITDDGPLVIETNVQTGLDHSQSGVGGLKEFFVEGVPSLSRDGIDK